MKPGLITKESRSRRPALLTDRCHRSGKVPRLLGGGGGGRGGGGGGGGVDIQSWVSFPELPLQGSGHRLSRSQFSRFNPNAVALYQDLAVDSILKAKRRFVTLES